MPNANNADVKVDDGDVEATALPVTFLLTGRYKVQQVFLDPVQETLGPEEVIRDYDSLIGMDKDIQLYGNLASFAAASLSDILSTNTHLQYTFESVDEDFIQDLRNFPDIYPYQVFRVGCDEVGLTSPGPIGLAGATWVDNCQKP